MSEQVRTSCHSRAAGFTLIELMVVVAVVAILAAIALPSYQDSVRKGRRGQAKADLVEVGQLAERYRTINSTYSGFALPAGFDKSPRAGTAFYGIAVQVAADGRTYTATATPVAGSAQAADRCGALALLSTGARFHERGEPAECSFGTAGLPDSD